MVQSSMSQPIFFSEGNLRSLRKQERDWFPGSQTSQEEDRVWNTWQVASSPFPHLCNGKLIKMPLGGSQVAT